MTQEETTQNALLQEYRLWMNQMVRKNEQESEGQTELLPSFLELGWRKKLPLNWELNNRQRITGTLIAYDSQSLLIDSLGRIHLIPLQAIARISLVSAQESEMSKGEEIPSHLALHSRVGIPFVREPQYPISPMYWDI